MATIAGVSLSTPRVFPKASDSPKVQTKTTQAIRFSWKRTNKFGQGRMHVRPVAAASEGLSEKVAESVKNAEEACSGDATSEECAAAWDEVEELSAAAGHAREKKKEFDPLETFCKDNPETDECRTYDN